MYPGHHTEHAVKEHLLVRERRRLEESIPMVPTPAALVSEGLAETGRSVVVDGDVPQRLVEILQRHGLEYDWEQAGAVREARRPLRRVGSTPR